LLADGRRVLNQLADLKGQPIEGVRAIRNEIRDRVEALILREGAR